jgi:hypothetical protein
MRQSVMRVDHSYPDNIAATDTSRGGSRRPARLNFPAHSGITAYGKYFMKIFFMV